MPSVASRILLLAVTAFVARGEVRLPHTLRSHMLLQRDRPVHIRGWSEPAEKVTVSLNAASRTAIGDRLALWSLYLPPEPGRPDTAARLALAARALAYGENVEYSGPLFPEASAHWERVLRYARNLARTEARIDYFATSLPALLLFNEDLQRRATITSLFLKAQSLLGLRYQSRGRRLLARVLKTVLADRAAIKA
jgi:hypothetical protein